MERGGGPVLRGQSGRNLDLPLNEADRLSRADESALFFEHGHTASAIGIAAQLTPGGFVSGDGCGCRCRSRYHVSRGSLELVRSRLGMRLMRAIADRQRLVAGFVTNVPGPSAPLSLAGAPVSNAWPISGLAGNVRLAVAALSYAGRLEVTVQAGADALPVDVFTAAMQEELLRMGAVN